MPDTPGRPPFTWCVIRPYGTRLQRFPTADLRTIQRKEKPRSSTRFSSKSLPRASFSLFNRNRTRARPRPRPLLLLGRARIYNKLALMGFQPREPSPSRRRAPKLRGIRTSPKSAYLSAILRSVPLRTLVPKEPKQQKAVGRQPTGRQSKGPAAGSPIETDQSWTRDWKVCVKIRII